MAATGGATKKLVELPILQCLRTGGWKDPGEIKDFVARHGSLPPGAKKASAGRGMEPQAFNIVQNAISESRAGSFVQTGLIEYDSFKGQYRITSAGFTRLTDLEAKVP